MITTDETVIGEIALAKGTGEDLRTLAVRAASSLRDPRRIGGVIAATFSSPRRFPSLAVEIAARLGLPQSAPAFDLQMACSAYPYAVYLASRLAADTGREILVIDGDVQSRLVDAADHATGGIFSDLATASVVSTRKSAKPGKWAFLSQYDEALVCDESGPIAMDGMKVFSFVAREVSAFLRSFVAEAGAFDAFVPHQANPYMIRQLARSLSLEDRLVTIPEAEKNPGSASVPLALASLRGERRALIAGFGAGYSAAAGLITLNL